MKLVIKMSEAEVLALAGALRGESAESTEPHKDNVEAMHALVKDMIIAAEKIEQI